MAKRIPKNTSAYRRRFVETARKLERTKPWIAAQLGITTRGVSQIARYPSVTKKATNASSKNKRVERIVSKGVGYTKAPMSEIAKRAGVSERHVRRIKHKLGVKRKYPLKTGSEKERGKYLSKEKVAEIKKLRREQELSEEALGELFGVSQPAIHYILGKDKKKKT